MEHVGITFVDNQQELKRLLLAFDRIATPIEEVWQTYAPELLADLKFLAGRGIVSDLDVQYESELAEPDELSEDEFAAMVDCPNFPQLYNDLVFRNLVCRLNTSHTHARFVSCVPVRNNLPKPIVSTPGDVVTIILEGIPQPSEQASLEQILSFRDDRDSKDRLLALRSWMLKAVSKPTPEKDLIEELDYLKAEYRRHMDLAKMKVDLVAWEATVVTASNSIGNAIKFGWGDIAKGKFILKHRKVDLLEAESKAPGREISYLVKAEDEFCR
jgi:hypothetical protein